MDELRWYALLDRQREQEEEMRRAGATRFKKRLEAAVSQGEATQAGAAKKLLQEALLPTEAAIARRLAVVQSGRKHLAATWVPMAGIEVCAYLTAICVLNHTDRMDAHGTAREIAGMVLDDIRASAFEKAEPGIFKYRMGQYKRERYKKRVEAMEWSIRNSEQEFDHLDLKKGQRVQLGTWLLDCFIEGTGLVERKGGTTLKGRKIQRETYLELTDATKAWVKERNENLLFRFPVVRPMLVEPLPWSKERRGGYRFGQRATHPLVKKVRREQQEKLKTADMPLVYAAVNALQQTPWQVNRDVLSLAKERMVYETEAMPPKPADIETNPVSRRAWKFLAHQVHDRNREGKRAALERMRVIRMAEELSKEERFYFPHNLDWRGRVYPLASALQPQGDDLSRGLLKFRDGVPMGESGGGWLAVHVANKMGKTPEGMKVSTMTFEERVAWVHNHEVDLRNLTDYPDTFDWWRDADEPYQFFAAAVEWVNFTLDGSSPEWVSHLPVSLDGTANGLQHFSALFRDSTGAAAVNLLPQSRPRDIYQRVADSVDVLCQQESTTEQFAALWLSSGLINRNLTKRCVMTFSYGSKAYGFAEQLNAYLKGEDWKKIRAHFADEKGANRVPAACRYMARKIWGALAESVVAAFNGMQWLQQCTKLAVAANGLVYWTAPGTKFPVVQRYVMLRRRQVETWLAGKAFKPSVMTETEAADGMKSVNGISPNYIHSLDAAALMLTVSAAREEGIKSFAMVHDSYGTHAGRTELLAAITREQFVRLYEEFDPLAKIVAEFCDQLPLIEGMDWPSVPPSGELDIGQVLQSRYFFG